jgi:hypothetical protein
MHSSYHPHYHATQVMIPCSCFIMMCTLYVPSVAPMLELPGLLYTRVHPLSAAMTTKGSRLSQPCPNSSFCVMGDAEVTSRSGSELQMSPPMEATSPSEVEEGEQPKCPGHGRGHGTGRGHTSSSSTHPGPKRVINQSRGQGKRPKARQRNTIVSWLHQPTSQ